MKCKCTCVMDVGPRSNQEDCLIVDSVIYQEDELNISSDFTSEMMILAVCDGMGGHAAGEDASRYVCEKLNTIVDFVDFSAESLEKILQAVQGSSNNSLPQGSGTTVAGLIVKDNRVIVYNAGDSRVYKITEDTIKCVSHDHSLVQDLVDQGLIDDDEAFKHPYRNVVNFGIGPAFKKAKDRYSVFTYEEALDPAASYLICSDGVSDLIQEDGLLNVLGSDPVSTGDRLLKFLKGKKLKDNTTYIIAQIEE